MLVEDHLLEPGAQGIRPDDLDNDAVSVNESVVLFRGKRLGGGLVLAASAQH